MKFSNRHCPLCASDESVHLIDLQVEKFCNVNKAYIWEGYKKLGFSGEEKFPLVRCISCGMVYSGYLPDDEFLIRVYEELIDQDICRAYSNSDTSRVHDRDVLERSSRRLNRAASSGLQGLKILDFGAGWGTYLEIARNGGAQTYAYEINRRQKEYLKAGGAIVLGNREELPTRAPYDIINCDQVLEHVPDPAALLKSLAELLTDNGVLYLSVPNYRDDFLYRQLALIGRNNSPKEMNPWEHLNYFSPDALKYLVQTGGLAFTADVKDTTELFCRREVLPSEQTLATPGTDAPRTMEYERYLHYPSIIREKTYCPELTVCVFTTGEPLFEQCMESLERQHLRPVCVELVKDVAPLDKAFAEGFSRVKTKYYVSVDADMVLFDYCLSFLYSKIRTDDTAFEAIARLEDPFRGAIEGIRIYNRDLVERLGGFPESCGPERRLCTEAKRFGCNRLYYYDVVGMHHPKYTIEEAFWKFKTVTDRLLLHNGGNLKCWRAELDELTKRYLIHKDDVTIAALAGFFYGVGTDRKTLIKDIDFRERDNDPHLKKLVRFLSNKRYYSATSMIGAPIYQQKKEMERLGRFIRLNGVRNALIYGAANTGFMLEMVLEDFCDVNVTAFIDGSPSKADTAVGDKVVYPPEAIGHVPYDAIFIGVSPQYQDEVLKKLISLNVDEKRIFRLYE